MVRPLLSVQDPLPGMLPSVPELPAGYRPTGPGRGRFAPEPARERFSIPDALFDHYAEKIGALGLVLYTVLRKYADGQGYCWPSHETMARESGMSKASVKRTLKVLRQHGLATWQAHRDPKGDPDANTYRVLPVGGQSSPKLPLLQCGMKSTLCLLHQFEEQQLLGWGQTWASPPPRPGTIHHQGFPRGQRDQGSLRGRIAGVMEDTLANVGDFVVPPIVAAVVFREDHLVKGGS
jgi:Helix-turn-helix domain